MTCPFRPGRRKTLPVETTRHAFAYVFAGAGKFCNASGPLAVPTEGVGWLDTAPPSEADNRSLVLFDRGDEVEVQAGDDGIRFLLVSGKPLEEPVAWYGPIVMNTQQQLRQAFEELEKGTFLKPESPKTKTAGPPNPPPPTPGAGGGPGGKKTADGPSRGCPARCSTPLLLGARPVGARPRGGCCFIAAKTPSQKSPPGARDGPRHAPFISPRTGCWRKRRRRAAQRNGHRFRESAVITERAQKRIHSRLFRRASAFRGWAQAAGRPQHVAAAGERSKTSQLTARSHVRNKNVV